MSKQEKRLGRDHIVWGSVVCIVTVLLSATVLLYFSTLHYPFQFDDFASISNNFSIRFDNPVTQCFSNARWLGTWLNTLNFSIGRFDPFWYRVLNLGIHLLAGLTLFFLVFLLCRSRRKKNWLHEHALLLGTITSGLFLLHPVQTQTVCYVIQARLEGLATLCVLLVLLFFTLFVQATNVIEKVSYVLLLILSSFLACGTKEIVVVAPLLVFLLDWVFLSQERSDLYNNNYWTHVFFAGGFWGLFVSCYLGAEKFFSFITLQHTMTNNPGSVLTKNADALITPLHFFVSQFRVVLHYLTMFFCPFGLSFEYDWTLVDSFFTFESYAPFIVLFCLFSYALYTLLTRERSWFGFGLLWFGICVAPRSSFIPSPEIACDYKTYLASVGVFFIMSVSLITLVEYLKKYWSRSRTVQWIQPWAALSVLVPLSIGSYLRTQVWQSNVSLWEDCVAKAPNKARVQNNYGTALSEAKRIDEAIVAYERAVELDPYYRDPLSNLAAAYSLRGEMDKAIDVLRKTVAAYPDYVEAYNNLGALLIKQKLYSEAESLLQKAVSIRPYYGKAYFNLAQLYEAQGDWEKACDALELATKGDFDTSEVFYKLGQVCLHVKRYKNAENAFRSALDQDKHHQDALFGLANAYSMQQRYEEAYSLYERLCRNNPDNHLYLNNLGEVFFALKDYRQAHELFCRLAEMQPTGKGFLRIATCLERMGKVDEAKACLEALLEMGTPEEFELHVKRQLDRLGSHKRVGQT